MMSSPEASGPSTIPGAWAATTPNRAVSRPLSPAQGATPAHRKPQDQALTPKAHDWLATLPPRYQPLATARRHPHIVNRLSELWGHPADLPALLRELMLSSRPGKREGFAFEVLTELADLQSLVEEMKQGRP